MRGLIDTVQFTFCGIAARDDADLVGAVVDMLGFDGVCFAALAEGGEDAAFSVRAQQGEQPDMSDAADLEGTLVEFDTASTPLDGMTLCEVYRPTERYVRAVLTAPDLSAAKYVAIVAVQFNPKYPAISNPGERHESPGEGTA